MKMPFGKHKNKQLIDLPKQYVQWLDRHCALYGKLKEEVHKLADKYDSEDAMENGMQDYMENSMCYGDYF